MAQAKVFSPFEIDHKIHWYFVWIAGQINAEYSARSSNYLVIRVQQTENK